MWAAPDTSCGLPMAAHIALTAASSERPCSTSVRVWSGAGSTFTDTSSSTASVPHEPAKKLGEVVAGDVLHHLAARLEGLAAAVDAAEAQQVIARRAGREAARAGEVAHHRADQGALPRSLPSSGPRSGGSKASIWLRWASSASTSRIGVPARRVTTSSSGA
jgi:hypothetical protein